MRRTSTGSFVRWPRWWSERRSKEAWRKLRACWLDLRQPRFQSPPQTRERALLRDRHDRALSALAAAGRLESGAAQALRAAFEEALSHIGMHGALC